MTEDKLVRGYAVTLKISQEDLCLAVEYWLKNVLGLKPDIQVGEVRTKVRPDLKAEITFYWSQPPTEKKKKEIPF